MGFHVFFFLLIICSPLILNRYILPYAVGNSVISNIVSASYDPVPTHGYSGWSIKYEFYDLNGNKYSGTHVGIERHDFEGDEVKVGDAIKVFFVPSSPKNNVPYIKSKYSEFSLRSKN